MQPIFWKCPCIIRIGNLQVSFVNFLSNFKEGLICAFSEGFFQILRSKSDSVSDTKLAIVVFLVSRWMGILR